MAFLRRRVLLAECRSEEKTKYTLDGLIAVLELSDRYMIPSGTAFACRELEAHPSFNNALRIKLSMSVRTELSSEWFKTALKAFFDVPAEKLTEEECCAMGGRLLHALLWHKRMRELTRRQQVSSTPGFYPCDGCSDPHRCYAGWIKAWDMIRSDCPETPMDTLFYIMERGDYRGDACIGCYGKTISAVQMGSGPHLASIEETFVRETVDTLHKRFM